MREVAKARYRIMAFVFDWLIVYFFCLLIMFFPIINLIKDIGNATPAETISLMLCLIVFSLSCFIFLVFYFVILPVILKGQTIGKKIFKIRVVKQNGSDVDYLTMFVREIIGMVLIDFASFGVTAIIRLICLAIKNNRLTYQDVLSSTVVIDVN